MSDKRPTIRSQVAELLGDDWDSPESVVRRSKPKRLTVDQAVVACPRAQIVAASDAGQEVAVAVLQDGSVVVFPDSCPHDGGLLSDGFVDGTQIVCARHGWEFDGHNGQCSGKSELFLACRVLRPASKSPAGSADS